MPYRGLLNIKLKCLVCFVLNQSVQANSILYGPWNQVRYYSCCICCLFNRICTCFCCALFVVIMLSVLSGLMKSSTHSLQGWFTGIGAIVLLPQYQGINPEGYGYRRCRPNRNKAQKNAKCVNNSWNILYQCSGYGLSQWETTLQCNVVSHWLNLILRMIPATTFAQSLLTSS